MASAQSLAQQVSLAFEPWVQATASVLADLSWTANTTGGQTQLSTIQGYHYDDACRSEKIQSNSAPISQVEAVSNHFPKGITTFSFQPTLVIDYSFPRGGAEFARDLSVAANPLR